MVGRIVSATQFDPKYAILVQNKDESLNSSEFAVVAWTFAAVKFDEHDEHELALCNIRIGYLVTF